MVVVVNVVGVAGKLVMALDGLKENYSWCRLFIINTASRKNHMRKSEFVQ